MSLGDWMGGIRARVEATLGAMLEKNISLRFEEPRKLLPRDFDALLQEGPVAISLPFGQDMGWHLLLPQSLAGSIADIASMGDGSAAFDADVHQETLREIFGQVEADLEPEITSVMGEGIDISPVNVSMSADSIISAAGGNPAIISTLEIEGIASGRVIILFEMGFSMQFSLTANDESSSAPEPKPQAPKAGKSVPQQDRPTQQPRQQPPVASPVSFEDFGPASSHKTERGGQNIDSLLDISLPIIIELGRAKMLIREVLDLGPGSVIELDKLSGEPVDLYVNDKKFARGEVVVIEENFGVRITELIKVEDRLKALK